MLSSTPSLSHACHTCQSRPTKPMALQGQGAERRLAGCRCPRSGLFPCMERIRSLIRSPLLGKQSFCPPGAGQPRRMGPREGPWSSWSLWGDSPHSIVGGEESLGQKTGEDQGKEEKEHGREAKESRPRLPGQEKEETEPALCQAVFTICSKETLTWSGSLTAESGRWWKGGGC